MPELTDVKTYRKQPVEIQAMRYRPGFGGAAVIEHEVGAVQWTECSNGDLSVEGTLADVYYPQGNWLSYAVEKRPVDA